jgi:hypothetical protein
LAYFVKNDYLEDPLCVDDANESIT